MKTTFDEIDQFLFELVRVQPGACSSIESAKYAVARTVAEVLWPKRVTKEQDDFKHIGKLCIYNDGAFCKKGLPGTQCDVVGCVAYKEK